MTSDRREVAVISLVVWGLLQPGALASPIAFAFTPESSVTYHVTHPLHHVDGTSHRVLGGIQVDLSGDKPRLVLPMRFGVPLTSFGSGNRNRDRNMLVTLDAARYPVAVIELDKVTWSAQEKADNKATATGEAEGHLTLHGVTHPITIPLSGTIDGKRLEVESAFSFLCSAYGIDRPALFFRPIDDKVAIDVRGVAQR